MYIINLTIIMGICCGDNQKNAIQLNTRASFFKDGDAFSRRRSKRNPDNKGIMSTKRTSFFAYNNENIEDVYIFKDQLGSGYFGTVRLAYFQDDPTKPYAVKSIDKSRLSIKQIDSLSREIDILSTVDHPNIIRYYETYTDSRYFHIVMEYLSGGDLLTGISRKKNYGEKEIAIIIHKLLSAISHIHSLGIVHRDLKPDNILYENTTLDSDIKIIDFGVSRQIFKNNDDLNSIVGTPYFVAPEVLSGKYDKKVDIWSVGIIMYVLMTGKPPFNAKSREELFEKIKTKDLPFPQKRDKSFYSSAGVSFLTLLTKKDPTQRPQASQLLSNIWFNIIKEKDAYTIEKEILDNMKSFTLPNLFQRTLLKLIVKELNSSQIQELKQAFTKLDKDNTGYLDSNKLEQAFHNLELPISKDEIQDIMENCNLNYGNSNRVNYTSFIAASIDKKELFSTPILREVFKHLDTNESGFLTREGIIKAFERTGKKKKEDIIIKMFEEVGLDKSSRINFEEFRLLITKNIYFDLKSLSELSDEELKS